MVDLGSTNGTYVNGRRVAPESPAPLERGDELRFGNARFGLVAPGDDLSQVGAGSARAVVRARLRGPRRASAVVVAVALFAGGGFALTAFLLKSGRLEQPVGEMSARSAAIPAVHASAGAAGAAASAAAAPARGSGPAEAGVSGAPASAGPEPQWLARLNYYRAMLRLPPVLEDPALSEADELHARYLVKSYADAIKGGTIGGEAHEENRASPWYSEKGALAGKSSDVSYWQAAREPLREPGGNGASPFPGATAGSLPGEMPWGSPGWNIDGWTGIPFHRLSLISPYLRRSGFGRYCEGQGCAAALDTLSDRTRLPAHPVPFAQPLRFPPPGATIGIRSLDSEWPDPLATCPGYARPAGLAVTLEVGADIDARLGAYRFTRAGGSSATSSASSSIRPPANLEACGFDASSYNNPDPVAQQRAREILQAFGAVVIIPRAPLERGASYAVWMMVNGQEYKWSFTTAP